MSRQVRRLRAAQRALDDAWARIEPKEPTWEEIEQMHPEPGESSGTRIVASVYRCAVTGEVKAIGDWAYVLDRLAGSLGLSSKQRRALRHSRCPRPPARPATIVVCAKRPRRARQSRRPRRRRVTASSRSSGGDSPSEPGRQHARTSGLREGGR
jgi:hypothetical protein